MFVFIKKVFHIGSLFLSNLINATPLSCVSMNNRACKEGQKLLMLTAVSLYFILLVLKHVNVVAVVVISMIHMQKYVLLML